MPSYYFHLFLPCMPVGFSCWEMGLNEHWHQSVQNYFFHKTPQNSHRTTWGGGRRTNLRFGLYSLNTGTYLIVYNSLIKSLELPIWPRLYDQTLNKLKHQGTWYFIISNKPLYTYKIYILQKPNPTDKMYKIAVQITAFLTLWPKKCHGKRHLQTPHSHFIF